MMTECEKFISVVDNDILKPSDAIILLEGDGLNRYQKAVELYKQNIAAMTANVFQEDERKAAECGMNGYVTKPVDMEIIYSVLEKWLPGIYNS